MTTIEQLDSRAFESNMQVKLMETEVTPEGVLWRYVDAPDHHTDSSYRAEWLRKRIGDWEKGFREGRYDGVSPNVTGDRLEVHNEVSSQVYDSPAMYYWRRHLVPSALALVPLQDPALDVLPGERKFPIDDVSRDFFKHSIDAIAIRSRAAIMSDIAEQSVRSQRDSNRVVRMVSVASGTAKPVISAIKRLDSDWPVHLTLIDNDKNAQSMADKFIAEADLANLTYRPKLNNILKDLVASDRLVDEVGKEQADFVDAMGIFEYIPTQKGRAVDFLRHTYQLVRPGGTLVLGNMLDTHPEINFNKYGIGWPLIHPRSREEIISLLDGAGITPEIVTGHQAADGVYAVIEVRKPVGS